MAVRVPATAYHVSDEGTVNVRIDPTPDPAVIRAAGGLLWWRATGEDRVALIHRPEYDDWSFPKGKLEPGETWLEAAAREVNEETGCELTVAVFAGAISYLVRDRPKIVLFWNMERAGECAFQPSKEVDRLEWLNRAEAMARLDHRQDRWLLSENSPR